MEKQPIKVIIVEDEHRIRENLVKKIPGVHSRFIVSAALPNGKAALELINRTPPDLVITDIKMPVMDGLELIEELYLTHPGLPVIILSGYDDFNYAKKAIHLGVKDYILKPASKKELAQVLRRLEAIIDKNRTLPIESAGVYDSTAAANELCSRITEHLGAHFKEDISIADLAETFNLNPTYMSRVFKQQTGRTPTRFLTDLRVSAAKKLMSDYPDLEIKEVAAKIGFEDQGYFSRLFKKETGTSPIEFRDSPPR